MAISTKHPSYADAKVKWDIMRDVVDGTDAIKNKGTQYLPATESMILDGMQPTDLGFKRYSAYKDRSKFPEYTGEAIKRYVGRLNFKNATVQVPDQMLPMLESITAQGETVHELIKRIHTQQLTTGRLFLMVDVPVANQTNPLPYLSLYHAEPVINWDNTSRNENEEELNLVVIEEIYNLRNQGQLDWNQEVRYRVLYLNNVDENAELNGNLDNVQSEPLMANKQYQFGIFEREGAFNIDDLAAPTYLGQTLDRLPGVFINCNTITSEIENPPLRGLADDCLSIYRSEADYRQSLHLQGQDTLVVIGGLLAGGDPTLPVESGSDGDEVRVGTGARIEVQQGGDAKFIGVSPNGIREQREALQYDRKEAQTIAGQVVQERANRESGRAINARVGAQVTTLEQIARTAAAGLEHALRNAARWMNLDPSDVIVTPNLDFDKSGLDTQELVNLGSANVPLSARSKHDYLRRQDFTELTFEEEIEQLRQERANEIDVLLQDINNESQTSQETTEESSESQDNRDAQTTN